MRLFHFTCEHGHAGIGRRGLIVPQIEHPKTKLTISWFTTEAWPDRGSTGLTSNYTPCDRMKYRYVVGDTSRCRAWLTSPDRASVRPSVLANMEAYGDCEHWWIADEPVPGRLG